jgi:hypothetical protein
MLDCVCTVVDMENKDIVYNEFVDINVAVASDKGYVLLDLGFYLCGTHWCSVSQCGRTCDPQRGEAERRGH